MLRMGDDDERLPYGLSASRCTKVEPRGVRKLRASSPGGEEGLINRFDFEDLQTGHSQSFPRSGRLSKMSVTTGTPAPDADGKLTEKLAAAGLAEPPAAANGNGNGAHAEDSGDEDEDDEEGAATGAGGDAAAKKKKKGKKKSGAAKKKAKAIKEKLANGTGLQQTWPEPTIGLSKIWPSGDYPEGEIVQWDESNFTDE